MKFVPARDQERSVWGVYFGSKSGNSYGDMVHGGASLTAIDVCAGNMGQVLYDQSNDETLFSAFATTKRLSMNFTEAVPMNNWYTLIGTRVEHTNNYELVSECGDSRAYEWQGVSECAGYYGGPAN